MSDDKDTLFHQIIGVRLDQIKILLRKNWILTKRNRRATILQILVPFLFVFFLFILQYGLAANERDLEDIKLLETPTLEQVRSVPRCIIGADSTQCWTIAYTTNDPLGDTLISAIAQKNGIPASEVKSFSDMFALDEFLDENRNSTQGAYILDFTTLPNLKKSLNYTIMWNDTLTADEELTIIQQTVYSVLPFQYALEKEFAFSQIGANININVDLSPFPHPELISTDVIRNNGPAFFFAALMFNFVIQIGAIVTEKENKLREGMNIMGLKDSVFWFTWWITNTIMNLLSCFILIISGYIFQFDFFLKNAFGTFFFLFILFGMAMVPAAFFVSTLVSKSRTATSLGFVIFLVGTILQGFVGLAYSESFTEAYRIIFSLLPFSLLAKGISDLGEAVAGGKDGLSWENRGNNAWFSLEDTYNWLILDFFIYSFLTWYFDNVLENSYGVSKPFYFFLMPSYWRSKKRSNKEKEQAKLYKGKTTQDLDEDVAKEQQAVLEGNIPDNTAVSVYNLQKVYKNPTFGCIPNPSRDYYAVKGSTFHIEAGQLFCLLGHNGAGKTTTISMMTGLFKPTGGDSIIYGHSIVDGMDQIRKVMGVCPQHDVLWDQLTAREHLEMFCSFKGLEGEDVRREVEERLKDVALENVADQLSSTFSGGMKRRLSTAIALCADPKIVFLDEPTTGMDPVSRRQVWNLIEKVKRGRVIILTTHSMEEADVLGDVICIMKKGKLEAYGTSLRLKNKFGAGYRITTLAHPNNIPEVQGFFEENLGLKASGIAETFVEYNIPRPLLPQLPSFFEKLESLQDKLGITDIQLSMTTLEEVFLTVAGLHMEE